MKIKFPSNDIKLINYPGGEIQIRLKPEIVEQAANEDVIVEAHVHSPGNFLALRLLASALAGDNRGNVRILNIPYLPYARADRRFVPGDCHGLQTFGEIMGHSFDVVNALDVHNRQAAYELVPGLKDASPAPLIDRAIREFSAEYNTRNIVILFPDEGAALRYSIPSHVSSVHLQKLYAKKKRNAETGAFEGFEVPARNQFESDKVLIIDDICDGGGTFIGISEALAAQGFNPRLGLYVTHGIFSRGISPLLKCFDRLYTTNSFGEQSIADTDYIKTYDAFSILQS